MGKKSRRRHNKAMGKQTKAPSIEAPMTSLPQNLATRLLYIQQRIEALDRLYNEEVSNLKKDVAEISVEFVRQAQAQGRPGVGVPEPAAQERADGPEEMMASSPDA